MDASPLVVVCGATGYLGRFLVKQAHAHGFRVRALARSESRLGDARPCCHEVFVGEATKADTLRGLCDGAAYVISSLGNRTLSRKPTCFEVDFQANLNILERAREASVSHFAFVSVLHGAETRSRVPQIEARERVVDALRAGSLPWTVIRPSGFFNDMSEFLKMAKQGRVWIPGGKARFNPIHGADLAEVCVNALGQSEKFGQEMPAGGPDVFTMREIAELAFEAVGKPPKISTIPPWMLSALGTAIRPFNGNVGSLILMMAVLAEGDARCEAYGTHRLGDFYRELASAA